MKINWSAIWQSVVVALLLGVGATVWRTYEYASRIPTLVEELAAHKQESAERYKELRMRSDANDDRLSDRIKELEITVAVLEGRLNAEAATRGKKYAPAVLER